jgi:glycosyltransferase involved in cell wall biosynthesis
MKQRVLHVIDHTGSGGAQVVAGYLLRALRDRYSCGVAVLGAAGHFSDDYARLGVPVTHLGSAGGRWNPLSISKLVEVIKRGRYDLVHTHLFKSNILGIVAARMAGARSILHDHTGVYPQSLEQYFANPLLRHSYYAAHRRALGWCDRAIVLTPQMQGAYVRHYPAHARKVAVVPNAVDSSAGVTGPAGDVRAELGLPAGTRLVAMVGRLDPEKDWDTFLTTAQLVRRQAGCAFLAIGSGPEEQRLRGDAGRRQLERVFFLGYRQDVQALLRQVDVFVLTSRREAFGLVLLEAMQAGCAVVATRSGGPEAIVADGVNGLLAAIGDAPAIARGVTRLLQDDELRARLCDAARRSVIERYSLEVVADRVSDLYQDILANRGSAPEPRDRRLIKHPDDGVTG